MEARNGSYVAVQPDRSAGVVGAYGFSTGQLPIGIQLVGKWLDEATLLRLGAMLERRGGLGERHPDL